MHGNRRNTVTTDRPAATAEQVQAMYNTAHQHAARAAQHDTNATKLDADAESRSEQLVRDVDAVAAADVEHARKNAADLIARAQAQAAQLVEGAERKAEEVRRQARADADELRRVAALQAQAERDFAAEQRRAQELWKWTAADAAAHADLPAVLPTQPFEPVPDDGLKPEATS